VVFEPAYGLFFWPLIGLAAGGFASLCFGNRGLPIAAATIVFALMGAAAGGLVTLAFTRGEPESGGFWTSLVTSGIGSVVALALWRAALEQQDRPPSPRGP
jgi:uncharacterized membrane protein YeaQ/YmgE (transglycosylase-associated protein family)